MTIFKDLLGNPQVKHNLLSLSQSSKWPQTLLFYGAEGVGKSHFADRWARHILQTEKREPADLLLIKPEGKAEMITMEQAQRIGAEAQKAPFDATSKWIIIDEADRLHPAAANALLKILEEPLVTTHFILVTSKKESLLPTIRSRCFALYFRPIPTPEIAHYLTQAQRLDPLRSHQIATLVQGSIGSAIRLAQESDLRPYIAAFFHGDPLMRTAQGKILEEACTNDGQLDRQRLELLLMEMAHYFRDLHVKEHGQPLYFDHEHLIWTKSLPSLERVFTYIAKIKEGLERNIKLQHLFDSIHI